MFTESLINQFARVGAELEVECSPPTRRNQGAYTLDVVADRFILWIAPRSRVEFVVPDARPRERHLLLVAREDEGATKRKFLCGHDERHWFAAGVPDARGVKSVADAMDALKPMAARFSQKIAGVRPKDLNRRHNAGYLRQGEWFFIPSRRLFVPWSMVRRNEPISRPGGKPHFLEEAYRFGGEMVWTNGTNILRPDDYTKFARQPKPPKWFRANRWELRRINAELYARGAVRHGDHATLQLDGWHRVVVNNESGARGERLLFLD